MSSTDSPNTAADASNNPSDAPTNNDSVQPVIEQPFARQESKPSLQYVLTHNQRGRIVAWMIDNATLGEEGLCARTVRKWPLYFRGKDKANQRASRYWKSGETIMGKYGPTNKHTGVTVTQCTVTGVKRVQMKASVGRGRKRAQWVTVLYKQLNEEFDRFRKAGVRFSAALLFKLAWKIIGDSDGALLGPNVRDLHTGKFIRDHVNRRWVQSFMQSNSIVCRSQCGKLMVSPAKRELIERQVAFHLGELARGFRSGSFKEEDLMSADETHFVINFHNHKTLARRGDDEVKYADVVSGDEGITMMVLLSGGRDASIQPPLMVFKNASSSYPIRGVEDNVPGVCYRTGPKGWMDSRVLGEWLRENRAVAPTHTGSRRILFIDNRSGHAITPEVETTLERKNIEVPFFPANATDLIQSADSHLIQKVKETWRNLWNDKLLELIKNNYWVDPRLGSGKLVNPEKKYLLNLAANVVREVNKGRHKKDGVL